MLDRQTMEIPHWRWEREQQITTDVNALITEISPCFHSDQSWLKTGLVFRTCLVQEPNLSSAWQRSSGVSKAMAISQGCVQQLSLPQLAGTFQPTLQAWVGDMICHCRNMGCIIQEMTWVKIIDTNFPVRNRSNALSFDQPCVTFFSERAALFMAGFKDWRYEITWNCLESVYFLDRKVHFVGFYRYF